MLLLAACLAVAACYGGEGALSLAGGSGLTDGDLGGGGAVAYPPGCDAGAAGSVAPKAARPATAPPVAPGTAADDIDDVLLFPVVLGGPGMGGYGIDCDPDAGPYGTCQ